jgi:erythromycin esterase
MLTRRSLLANASTLAVTGARPVLAQDDPRIAWLQANASPLRSIDPADADFSDLEPLGSAIGDSRIVMLGEQTHGDGATFEGKCRLVRFLHQRMGFDVLAFESGLYEMRKAWDALRAGEDARIAAPLSILFAWSRSREAQPVIDYIGANVRSGRPLEIAGFDCQFSAFEDNYARQFLLADLVAFLDSHGVDTASMPDWPRFHDLCGRFILDACIYGYRWRPPEDDYRFILTMFDTLIVRTASAQGADAPFWRQLIKSMRAEAEVHFWMPRSQDQFTLTDNNGRDMAMGDNLVWLARDVYPQRKIIVWAATLHNMRNSHRLGPEYRRVVSMGDVAAQALGRQIYNLAFTCYEGESGWLQADKPDTLKPPPAGSLEALWASTSHRLAFVDFRNSAPGGEWLHAPMTSWLVRHEDIVTTDWSQIVDGVVFIRTMRRATRVN